MNIRANELTHVGHSVPGVDSRAKLTGRAVYTTDLQIEGMLHVKILRSTLPHARIEAIDISAALAMPGVIAIVTGADLAGLDPYYGAYIRDQTVLAIDKVRYVGEPLAAVAALDEAQAYRALECIRVEYEPLPSLMTAEESLATDAPALFASGQAHDHALPPPPPHSEYTQEPSANILFEYRHGFGDVDEWFARSAHVFEHSFNFARLSHYGLESHVSPGSTATPSMYGRTIRIHSCFARTSREYSSFRRRRCGFMLALSAVVLAPKATVRSSRSPFCWPARRNARCGSRSPWPKA
jgi:CO/xanthine dehydrogenase Mo-binding subunit